MFDNSHPSTTYWAMLTGRKYKLSLIEPLSLFFRQTFPPRRNFFIRHGMVLRGWLFNKFSGARFRKSRCGNTYTCEFFSAIKSITFKAELLSTWIKKQYREITEKICIRSTHYEILFLPNLRWDSDLLFYKSILQIKILYTNSIISYLFSLKTIELIIGRIEAFERIQEY